MNTARTRQIRIVSKIFRFLALFGLIFIAVGTLAVVIFNFESGTVGMEHWQIKDFKPEFSWVKRPLVLVVMIFPAVALWRLYRLFNLTSAGSYFTRETVGHIKFLAYWMIAYRLASFFLQFVQLLSTSNHADIRFSLDGYVLGGLLVLLLAWIMDEGRQLQEEQELTV